MVSIINVLWEPLFKPIIMNTQNVSKKEKLKDLIAIITYPAVKRLESNYYSNEYDNNKANEENN